MGPTAARLICISVWAPLLVAFAQPPPEPSLWKGRTVLYFRKSPTAARPVGGVRWLQQDPDAFSRSAVDAVLHSLNLTAAEAVNASKSYAVGVMFQFELLDCFLSPHTCAANVTEESVARMMEAVTGAGLPVSVGLDPFQFWYESGLWNWWNESLPGFNASNVENVLWTGWGAGSATKLAWRDWGSQFRMPTPGPNVASPQVLARAAAAVSSAVSAIRRWYESAPPSSRELLAEVRVAEEADLGGNYYLYPNPNSYVNKDPKDDPFERRNRSEGLWGGYVPTGYNMLRSMGLRASGPPPTRQEATLGVRRYLAALADAASDAWPLLRQERLLTAHAGNVEDPLQLEWSAASVEPAVPTFSMYVGPGQSPGQPGLGRALQEYDPSLRRFCVGEFSCMGCRTQAEWFASLLAVSRSAYGTVVGVTVSNLDSFVASPGAVPALRQLLLGEA